MQGIPNILEADSGGRMTGSAFARYELRGTFHEWKKEMRLRRIGGGPGGGRGSGFRSDFASADDGKRFVEVNGVNAAARNVS